MKKTEQQNPQDAKLVASNNAATIPAQYQNLSSEEVEQLWQPKIYVDPEKTKAERERREQVLEQIRQKETQREKDKEVHFAQIYSNLPPEKQKDFAKLQTEAANEIGAHLKGTAKIPNLAKEEAFVLDKMQEAYEEAKKKNPNQPIQIQLSQPIDQAVYNNLVRRLGWEKLKDKIGAEDQSRIEQIRQQTQGNEKKQGNEDGIRVLAELINETIKLGLAKRPDLLIKDLDKTKTENNKANIVERIIKRYYYNARTANYPLNQVQYDEAFNFAVNDKSLESKISNDWIYRGVMAKKGEKTITRGSLNVEITPELVNDLDNLIKNGIIKANYKFGEVGKTTMADTRHDSITIYFLEKPSEEALNQISLISKKYFRGNQLLGDKINEGFYLSNVGSVSDKHAKELIDSINQIDGEIGKVVEAYLTDARIPGKIRTAMSEAQYWSVKKGLNAYGYDIEYDETKGFTIKKL